MNGKKWNGKWKFNDEIGNLRLEGDFINGKLGNVKSYNDYNNISNSLNGQYEIEGEYLNELENGIEKEYYSNGSLKFEGE